MPFANDADAHVERIVRRLKSELEPALQRAAWQAAASEHERTRAWLEGKGLPKAARVAQRETYEVLRRSGLLKDAGQNSHASVGRDASARSTPRVLSEVEVSEIAEACLALFEVKGQAVEVTIAGMDAASGGFLMPEDASRVLEKVQTLLGGCRLGEGREL